jgi:predicted nuclease with RNAse H fold
LGIDFSGNFRMWSAGCSKSNVWIAEVECGVSRPTLVNLRRVQQLSGDHNPFTRLVEYLRQFEFDAAAIDAPFSVPSEHLRSREHRGLLELVAKLESRDGRPFPSARDFVNCILEGRAPAIKKPLRQTEDYWQQRKVNVRSTLWAGPRGGSAMTGACLKLLHETGRPIWPWERAGRGLLIEAFPAAQLCQWDLLHQGYNRNTEKEADARRFLVSLLVARINLGNFRQTLEHCADALDSVICAFAAIAVMTGRALSYAEDSPDAEGLIAVERGWL